MNFLSWQYSTYGDHWHISCEALAGRNWSKNDHARQMLYQWSSLYPFQILLVNYFSFMYHFISICYDVLSQICILYAMEC